ncbi:MAG: fumarate hydratase [Firmicutes bacterium]|nr:fumarate hydratase [Bacillota bacterium]
MREVDVKVITEAVARLAIDTNYDLSRDVKSCIHDCRLKEIREAMDSDNSGLAADILGMIEDNIELAAENNIPLCQDTGLACVFIDIGQDVHLTGGDLREAINEGVRRGYEEGYLRKSVVADPFTRINTQDNTPAHIVMDIVPGENVNITVAPKGFGSENMSSIKMFPPAAGIEGAKNFIVETVKNAGGNPCPPLVVGVGIGSTFDGVALLAKKALLLPLDERNEDPAYAVLEDELLERITELDIGPQGVGGTTTALAVKILTAPNHIAGMPVAVNINCHVQRHKSVTI